MKLLSRYICLDFHVLHNLQFLDAIRYHDAFASQIEFHNYYVTEYFKKIDRRRIRAGRSHLLPLKNVESYKLVDPNSTRRIKKEFEGHLGLILQLALQILTTTFFIALDRIYFEVLDIIARHSQINYLQWGVHDLRINVNGTGFISNLIRASVNGFNINEHIKVLITNEPCLPRPSLVASLKIIRIYLIFLWNFYLIYNQVYIHRARRFVCAYFYPKREKKRILYLYNKMLRHRKQLFAKMIQIVKNKLQTYGAIKQKRNFLQVNLNLFCSPFFRRE